MNNYSSGIVGTEITSENARHLINRLFLNPGLCASEFVTIANSLLPFLETNFIQCVDKVKLIQSCADKAIRHEGIISKCIWDILKEDVRKQTILSIGNCALHKRDDYEDIIGELDKESCKNTISESKEKLSVKELSFYTAITFRIMCEMNFVNDRQMLILALGRCIEFTGELSLAGVAEIYRALFALNKAHVSLTDAAEKIFGVIANDLSADNAILPFTVNQYEENLPTADEITYQPNLIDVLCGELEKHLSNLWREHHSRRDNLREFEDFNLISDIPNNINRNDNVLNITSYNSYVCSLKEHKAYFAHKQQNMKVDILLNCYVNILRGMATVGVSDAMSIRAIHEFIKTTKSLQLEFLVDAFRETCAISDRIVDVLQHTPSDTVKCECDALTHTLATKLLLHRNIANYLRLRPQLVLQLRQIFELNETLYNHASSLWDILRRISVSHRHVNEFQQHKYAANVTKQLGGKLFTNRYKLKKSALSNEAAKASPSNYIPPEFKKQSSIEQRKRRNRRNGNRLITYQRFGVRRIKADYLPSLRKKYAPAL